MGGTVVIIILLTVVVPVAIMITGLLASALLGFILKKDVDAEFEGHELLELSQNS
jgi:hypothetical protein